MSGILYIIATPIGNLGDITIRAIETLKQVDLIACEDTRRTIKLLNHFEIKQKMVSLHMHSKLKKIDFLVEKLFIGENIALVTDAGTPGICDPGGQLVQKAIENGIEAVAIPGVSALATILSISGNCNEPCLFLGYLPKKGRENFWQRIFESAEIGKFKTICFYESCHRIEKTLKFLLDINPNFKLVVARELTKKFETVIRGDVASVLEQLKNSSTKGEFTALLIF